ncbi:MAG: hypothetical protein ACM31L_18670 [Actinomycetota bacterium]
MDRDALERRYDGPVPPADPAAVPGSAAGRARLYDRLAAEARGEIARLRAASPVAGGRLARLGRDLAFYRCHGVGWRAQSPSR